MNDDLKTIIHAAQRGDEHAFRRLVERHYHYVSRISYRVLLDDEDARDAAQETFVKLWMNIAAFNTAMNFTTWLYKIVANTALDHHRARSRRPAVVNRTSIERLETPIEPQRDTDDLQRMVRSVLGHLPPVQRLIFALRDIEDLSISDVAAITGSSTASVKTNLSYARKRMRELLAAHYDIRGTNQ